MSEGANAVQEISGGTVSANMLDGLGVDEYFQRADLLGTWDYLDDALGSTLALADASGTVQTEYTYSPFGSTTTQGQASPNSYQFTGRENDGEGLYFYRARYYSPMVGRLVAQDPIGLGGGINLYAYVYDNPINVTDLLGLCGKSVGGCIAQSLAGNGVALGLDVAGFVPGVALEEGLTRTLTDVGVGIASTINSAVHQDTTGALMGIGGIHLAPFEKIARDAGGDIAGDIPVLSYLLNTVSTVRDISKAYKDYEDCQHGN